MLPTSLQRDNPGERNFVTPPLEINLSSYQAQQNEASSESETSPAKDPLAFNSPSPDESSANVSVLLEVRKRQLSSDNESDGGAQKRPRLFLRVDSESGFGSATEDTSCPTEFVQDFRDECAVLEVPQTACAMLPNFYEPVNLTTSHPPSSPPHHLPFSSLTSPYDYKRNHAYYARSHVRQKPLDLTSPTKSEASPCKSRLNAVNKLSYCEPYNVNVNKLSYYQPWVDNVDVGSSDSSPLNFSSQTTLNTSLLDVSAQVSPEDNVASDDNKASAEDCLKEFFHNWNDNSSPNVTLVNDCCIPEEVLIYPGLSITEVMLEEDPVTGLEETRDTVMRSRELEVFVGPLPNSLSAVLKNNHSLVVTDCWTVGSLEDSPETAPETPVVGPTTEVAMGPLPSLSSVLENNESLVMTDCSLEDNPEPVTTPVASETPAVDHTTELFVGPQSNSLSTTLENNKLLVMTDSSLEDNPETVTTPGASVMGPTTEVFTGPLPSMSSVLENNQSLVMTDCLQENNPETVTTPEAPAVGHTTEVFTGPLPSMPLLGGEPELPPIPEEPEEEEAASTQSAEDSEDATTSLSQTSSIVSNKPCDDQENTPLPESQSSEECCVVSGMLDKILKPTLPQNCTLTYSRFFGTEENLFESFLSRKGVSPQSGAPNFPRSRTPTPQKRTRIQLRRRASLGSSVDSESPEITSSLSLRSATPQLMDSSDGTPTSLSLRPATPQDGTPTSRNLRSRRAQVTSSEGSNVTPTSRSLRSATPQLMDTSDGTPTSHRVRSRTSSPAVLQERQQTDSPRRRGRPPSIATIVNIKSSSGAKSRTSPSTGRKDTEAALLQRERQNLMQYDSWLEQRRLLYSTLLPGVVLRGSDNMQPRVLLERDPELDARAIREASERAGLK